MTDKVYYKDIQDKYQLIVADPPHLFETWSDKGRDRSPDYDLMDDNNIMALPIFDIAADDAILAIWGINPKIFELPKIAAAWGFSEYSGIGFTWVKLNKVSPTVFWGLGYGTRKNSESCWFFKRGKGLKRQSAGVNEIIVNDSDTVFGNDFGTVISPYTVPSKKPNSVFPLFEKLYGNVKRIELFARQHEYDEELQQIRSGWDVWGNEIESSIEFVKGRGY